MKRLYWRPQKCSRAVIFAIGLIAITGLVSVEYFTRVSNDGLRDQKVAAARLARESMTAIREERLASGHAIDPELDPTGSGLIGATVSPVTTNVGHLASKQAATNPNFAAAILDMLVRAGVQRGDCVAVGYTGSLPGVNVNLCAALETLGARPIIIHSAASSQFGANLPDQMWLDMETTLHQRGLIHFRSIAASLGGAKDRGVGLSDEGRELIRQAIERNNIPLLTKPTFTECVDERLRLYHEHAGGAPIKAYVNAGGGSVSTGRALGKEIYQPGLNVEPPPGATEIDCVMTRFMNEGTPVIHLVEVQHQAKAYGLPTHPTQADVASIGVGSVYGQRQYNRWLAGAVLLLIVGTLRAFVLTSSGYRFLKPLKLARFLSKKNSAAPQNAAPELMV